MPEKIKRFLTDIRNRGRRILTGTAGDLLYVDVAVKILIAVVVGFLLLYLCYNIVEGKLLPTVAEKWDEFYNYAKSFPTG